MFSGGVVGVAVGGTCVGVAVGGIGVADGTAVSLGGIALGTLVVTGAPDAAQPVRAIMTRLISKGKDNRLNIGFLHRPLNADGMRRVPL